MLWVQWFPLNAKDGRWSIAASCMHCSIVWLERLKRRDPSWDKRLSAGCFVSNVPLSLSLSLSMSLAGSDLEEIIDIGNKL